MIVDWHCHWVPPSLCDLLRSRDASPRLTATETGQALVPFRELMAFGPAFHDIDDRLRRLDRLGVTRQVLSLPGLFGIDSLPAAQACPLVRNFNEEMSRLATRYPDRFSGLVALPLDDPQAACRELERGMKELGLIGVVLPGDGFLTLEAARRFTDVFAVADRLGAHVFVHPGPLPGARPDNRPPPPAIDNAGQRRITLETQAKLSSIMITLEMTDFLAPFPRVTVQVANLGGALPFLLDRIEQVHATFGEAGVPAAGRVYVDTASFGARSIALAVSVFGADRVLFGSDDPIFSIAMTADGIRKSLTAGDQRQVFSANGGRLLKVAVAL